MTHRVSWGLEVRSRERTGLPWGKVGGGGARASNVGMAGTAAVGVARAGAGAGSAASDGKSVSAGKSRTGKR